VQGEQLSCVIIDRLPFASPGEPVVKARIAALRRQGGNPFRDYQIPEAVLALKQGTGRLLRSRADRGVVALLDARLRTQRYGALFLASLPPYRTTHSLDDVRQFFQTGSVAS
jgi:ATP-dependent DNA helicase DinG